MGIFNRLKRGASSKVNAALDRAIDPAKQLDQTILELEAGRQKALAELVSYKTSAKTMGQEIERLTERVALHEQRAMRAVRAGEDDLARQCLKEKKDAEAELGRVTRDRDEMAGHAIQLNRSRKELDTKLQLLKLKKGTLATQLAAARGKNPLGDAALFDKLAAAEARIDADADLAEVDASLADLGTPGGGGGGGAGARDALAAEIDRKLPSSDGAHGDDALAELKAKMKSGSATKPE